MRAVPAKLGRYEIVKHLANGGMAQVLIARATGIEGFERHVVVKRINAEHVQDPAFVQMFLDEARTAAALHHNNIVQVHDIGKENGEYFFAMEYVHGQDLRILLREHAKRKDKMPWEHVVTIMTAAASGLHHAHELRGPDRKLLGLVHRDVSPANILVGYDGTVKVVDFGIAKAALRTGEGTNGGALKGKVSYMAPEQCAGKPVDRRSDVYALGVVLYELCTVRRLFKGDNDFLTMSAIVTGEIPHPSKARPDIPPRLAEVILKALSKRPADRYQTADEMRLALEAYADEERLRTSTGALASYMKQLFGTQPEPWLIEEEAELELTVDFDGSASGLAQNADDVVELLAIPDSVDPGAANAPIMAARRRITDAPPLISIGITAEGSQALKTKGTGTGLEAVTARAPTKTGTGAKPLTIQIPTKTPVAGVPITTDVPTIPRTLTPPSIPRTRTPPPAIPVPPAPDPGAVARKKSSSLPPPIRAAAPVAPSPERVSQPSPKPVEAKIDSGWDAEDSKVAPPAVEKAAPPEPAKGVAAKPLTPPKGVAAKSSTPPHGVATKPLTPPHGVATKPLTPPKGVATKSLTPPKGVAGKPATPPHGVATKPLTPPKGVPAKPLTPPKGIATNAATGAIGLPPEKPEPIAEPSDAVKRLMATPPPIAPPERPSESPVSPLKLLDPKPAEPARLPEIKADDFATDKAVPVIARPAVEELAPVEVPASKPDPKKLALIGAAALLAIVVIILIAKSGGGEDKPTTRPPDRGSAIDPPKKPEPPPVAIDPGSAAGSNTGPKSGSGSAIAGSGSAVGAGSGSAVKKKPPQPPPKKKWNPDELFIK